VEEISVQLLLCRIDVGLTLLLSASDRENFKRWTASRVDLTRTGSNNCHGNYAIIVLLNSDGKKDQDKDVYYIITISCMVQIQNW
jgi:hypothetical protein